MGYTDRVGSVLAACTLFSVLSLTFVILRLYVRLFKKKGGLWWDDWLIVVSEIFTISCNWTIGGQVALGYGKHWHDLPPDPNRLENLLKTWFFGQLQYFVLVGTIKLSILCFYLRLSRSLHPAVYATMAFISACTIATTLVTIFQCTPLPYMWDKSIPGGHCINTPAFWLSASALSMAGDIIIYILPMKTVWQVKLPIRQRMGLLFVFAAGLIVVVLGFVRLHSLTITSQSDDVTWVNIPCQIWSLAELNIGIICACLPSLKPLVGRFLGLKSTREPTPVVKASLGKHSVQDPFPITGGGDTKNYTVGSTLVGTIVDVERLEEGEGEEGSKEDLTSSGVRSQGEMIILKKTGFKITRS